MSVVSWDELLAAYVRAKADSQAQRGLPLVAPFLRFEQDFKSNLEAVLNNINDVAKPLAFRGEIMRVPKARDDRPEHDGNDDTIDPSEPETIARLIAAQPRFLFRPSVETLVISSVWMARFAPALDSLQAPNSYGNRLNPGDTLPPGTSFKDYTPQYTKWRDRALKIAARAASESKHVEIVTFDIQNFYGSIDANFLLTPEFESILERSGRSLSDEIHLTRRICQAVSDLERPDGTSLGLPIGLPASAVIANSLLHEMDTHISSATGVLYYGRYVDDVIIVRKPSKKPGVPPEQYAQDLLDKSLPPYAKPYSLRIAAKKTRRIKISPSYSATFLSELRRTFRGISSEWRRLPTEKTLDNLAGEIVAAGTTKHIPPAIRDADTLSLRRWTFATFISKHIHYIDNLPTAEWTKLWSRQYRRLAPTVLGAANLPATIKHLRDFIVLSGSLGLRVGEAEPRVEA